VDEKKHPSQGGNPYSQDMRDMVITRYQLGLPLVSPDLDELRQEYQYPSLWLCWRYIRKFIQEGHARPKHETGNHMAERQVLGQHLVRLALYRVVHPEGTITEARAFLSNMDPTIAPFNPKEICRAEHLLGLRKKAASTTCVRAYWAINLHKRDMFWTWNYPFGRADVNTSDMIDMDECGLKIEASNPSFGKCVSWERCHFDGAYNRERKLNLMMAISADKNYDMEWHSHWPQEEGGTNLFRMYRFIESIIDRLAIDWPGRSFCFTMDNLNVHHSPVLLTLISNHGHRYLFRAPFWSVDRPMEYIFNSIHTLLLRHFCTIDDLAVLGNCIDTVIAQMTGFNNYFQHVGFPDN